MSDINNDLKFDLNDFTVKNNKRFYFRWALLTSIPVVGVTLSCFTNPQENAQYFYKSPIGLTILSIFIIGCSSFLWFQYFNNKVKLIINKKGIWTKPTDLIPWDNLWYVYIKEKSGKYLTTKNLIIRVRNSDKKYNVELTFLDKNGEEILNAIKLDSKEYNIQFLDPEIG